MEAKLYYTPPTDEKFHELKEKAMEIWRQIGGESSYSAEKINAIKDIENVGDNFMYMVAMFDINNQNILAHKLSPETRTAVYERMVSAGQPDEYNVFN